MIPTSSQPYSLTNSILGASNEAIDVDVRKKLGYKSRLIARSTSVVP